ncbi:hypothetical protein CEK25_012169 [Fusarium fujikuroi]|nr:hypothetical protein CEK25_012169 [Fusarium fujikuroi]
MVEDSHVPCPPSQQQQKPRLSSALNSDLFGFQLSILPQIHHEFNEFIDPCTGDGHLLGLAGAPFRIGAEKRDEFVARAFAPSSEYGHLLHSIYFYTKEMAGKLKYVEHGERREKFLATKEMGCNLWWIEYGGRDTIHDTEQIPEWELWKAFTKYGANLNGVGIRDSKSHVRSADIMELLPKSCLRIYPGWLMRQRQRFPGYKLLLFEEAERSTPWNYLSRVEHEKLPADGAPCALVQIPGYKLNDSEDLVPSLAIAGMSFDNFKLMDHLRGFGKSCADAPPLIKAVPTFSMQPCQKHIDISFEVGSPTTQHAFEVENPQTQCLPSPSAVNSVALWTPVRRHVHQHFDLTLYSPPSDVGVDEFCAGDTSSTKVTTCLDAGSTSEGWGVENICGVPPDQENEVAGSLDADYDHLVEKILRDHPGWDNPVKVNKWRLLVHFDTDYDHALESVNERSPREDYPVSRRAVLDLSSGERELYEDENTCGGRSRVRE